MIKQGGEEEQSLKLALGQPAMGIKRYGLHFLDIGIRGCVAIDKLNRLVSQRAKPCELPAPSPTCTLNVNA